MCIYSIVNVKGGATKSTTAVMLAAFLKNQDFTVAFLNCDDQQFSSDWVEKLDMGIDVHTTSDLEGIEDLLEELEEGYNAVVVDTAGSAEEIMRSVIGVSTHVLVPITPSPADLESSEKTIKQILRAKKRYKRDITATIFLTRVVKNTLLQASFKEKFTGIEGIEFSSVEIPLTQRMMKIGNTNQTAFNAPNCKDLAKLFNQLFSNLLGG